MSHLHLTEKCVFLPHANQTEKGKVIYKHRACSKFLGTRHYYKNCSTTAPGCPTCNISNHGKNGCPPADNISNIRVNGQTIPGRQEIFRLSSYSRAWSFIVTSLQTNWSVEGLAILDDLASIISIPCIVPQLGIQKQNIRPTTHTTTTIQCWMCPTPYPYHQNMYSTTYHKSSIRYLQRKMWQQSLGYNTYQSNLRTEELAHYHFDWTQLPARTTSGTDNMYPRSETSYIPDAIRMDPCWRTHSSISTSKAPKV